VSRAEVSEKKVQKTSVKSKPTESSQREAAPVRHKVKKGETLSSIANEYNTTVAALKRDNQIGKSLKAGTVLVIKKGI
jgi:LysM repeat protein